MEQKDNHFKRTAFNSTPPKSRIKFNSYHPRLTPSFIKLGKGVEEVGFLLGLLVFVVLSFVFFYFGLPNLVEAVAKINGSGIILERIV